MANNLMGNDLFRMGMGILEGATPQATPPNAIANMMRGLGGARDARYQDQQRMLQKQQAIMQLKQMQRAQEKWKYEKAQLESQEEVMRDWANPFATEQPQNVADTADQSQNVVPSGFGSSGIGGAGIDGSAIRSLPQKEVDPQDAEKVRMRKNYTDYLKSLEWKKRMAAANRDFDGVAAANKEMLEVQKAMQDLKVKGFEADRYKQSGFVRKPGVGERSRGMMYDTYTGTYVVDTTEGKVPYDGEKHGSIHTKSQQDIYNNILATKEYNNLENSYYDGVYSLGQVNDLYRMVEMQDDGGLNRIADKIAAKFRGAYGEDLTTSQMATMLSEGETGKLAGSMRIELFGGGPLTDTEREFAMDLIKGNWTANKAVMKQRLLRIFRTKEDKIKRYGSQYAVQQALRGNPSWQPEELSNYAISRQTDFLDETGSTILDAEEASANYE